jgi:putative isomerase
MLGRRLPSDVRAALINGLKRPGGLVTSYGLCTEALDSPLYNPESYVKGPSWAPLNTFLIEALYDVGETDLARKIQVGFCETILNASGSMSEHFDTRTGAPGGDPAYNWTAALFLLLASQKHQDGNLWA